MANKDHLKRLKACIGWDKWRASGPTEWNEWRNYSARVYPDLSDAFLPNIDLGNVDLHRANLRNTNLSNASLAGANLSKANLSSTDLRGINLIDADLSDADLNHANLSGSYLRGTKLVAANLSDANLNNIYLRYADLSQANLSQANLSGSDLSNIKMCYTHMRYTKIRAIDLRKADLRGAILTQAILNDVYLRSADLSGANLSDANLSDVDLSGSDLSGTDLSGADLRNVDLSGANLSGARVRGTVFVNVNLRTTKGLLQIRHTGPSVIGLDTIQLPQDGSAFYFLRETGLSDALIDFYRTLVMVPIQYHSCFISYSSSDEILARRLHADLQDHGVRCWFAPEDMKTGDKIRARIEEAIHLQEKLLLLLSKRALDSDWVEMEVEAALEKERRQRREVLFPVRMDESVMQASQPWAATLRRTRHIGDFTRWADPQAYQRSFERLLRDLKKTATQQEGS